MGAGWRLAGMAGFQVDAAGDEHVQPAQQGGCPGGAGLLAGQPVVVAGGQAGNLAACTGLVAWQRCQHRPPGGQPQRGPAAAPDHALALLLAAGVVRGHSPACPASARGWRTGPSPDSARKAALAAVSPPIEVATPVRPSLPEASLIAQAEQILPQAIHDARDQGLTWTQIGELLNTTAATAARRYRNKP